MSNYSRSKFNDADDNTSWQKTFRLVPEKSTVLDIGCSSGSFGKRLIEEKDCVVDGIEIDDGDIKKAKKILRNVYKYNIETDDLKLKNKYDIIFMGDVIEHLARPIEALKKVRALLKPSGKLVFSVPNITHMSVRLMLLSGNITYGRTGLLDETHLHFYNSTELYRVLNSAGFKVEVFDYTVNDIPEKQLKQELAKLGLSTQPKFKKLANSLDTVAYQFVGVAVPGPIKKQQLPATSPDNIVSKYIDELNQANKENIERIVARQKQLEKENQTLKARLNKLAHPIKYIRNKVVRKK